jgi:tetratricopeptide (TPR) repeat protein
MDEQTRTFYELRFRAQFLESKAGAFQDMFVDIMSKAHPGDFFPCRPWGNIGDRKNDGYLKSERILFQVYAPNEMRMVETIKKIEEDFTDALPYWQNHFDTWVFVHNAHGGLPPDVIGRLLELEQLHAPIKVTHWGFEELLLRFRLLSLEALTSLYGSLPPGAETKKSKAHGKRESAQDLIRGGKHSEAIKEMTESLAIARAEGDEEEEVEILCALVLISHEPHGRGDQQHYFQEAEKRVGNLKSNTAKVIYFRARAVALQENRDLAGAEEAYKAALHICSSEPDDEKRNLAIQGCIVRSSFVHLLCNEKRLEEARPILAECEEYARQNKDTEEGELFHAAIEAGIHLSLEAGDEDDAVARITELEGLATTFRLANRIGGDLNNIANRSSHRKAHRTALAAAEAAVRIGQRYDDGLWPFFLVGALYTEAMVIMQAGEDEKALPKAEAILDMCHGPEAAVIRQATQHLIAEIRRLTGDSQTAVDIARQALSIATGRPEDVGMAKLALARALNDNGQTEEALKQAKEAWILARPTPIPAEGVVEFLSHITHYASQLGFSEDVKEAFTELDHLIDESEIVKAEKAHAIECAFANQQLRQRFLEVLQESEPAKTAGTEQCASLAEANALVVRPLLGLWDEIPERLAVSYDFWGRGNFERMLLNARCFSNSFNVTLEVRSLNDVKKAIRLWGLYADFLILLWKGETQNGQVMTALPEDYEDPGGWGYIVAAGTVLKKEGSAKKYYPALSYISMFPDEVADFLATEARPFMASGRLVIVPAVGAGCINPGHGPFEQLLAEAANAIPSVRWKRFEGTPIGSIPHSPNCPFELLAELAEAESDRLRKLRLLLLKRSQELRPDSTIGMDAKILSLEIEDALRDMEDRNNAFARKKGLEKGKEQLTGATARFRSTGEKLTEAMPDSPFAPLFILQSLGYGWRVDSPQILRLPSRFEPREGDVVGTWLAPPSAGWTIPTVSARLPSDQDRDETEDNG